MGYFLDLCYMIYIFTPVFILFVSSYFLWNLKNGYKVCKSLYGKTYSLYTPFGFETVKLK